MRFDQQTTKRVLRLIFFIMLMDIVGMSILFPVAPYIVQRYSSDALMVTMLTVIYAGAQFFAAPALGKISDRLGRRPVLLVSVLGSAVGYFIFGAGGAFQIKKTSNQIATTKKQSSSLLKRVAAVIVLFVLSPFIAEILLGATPVSRLESLLPVTMLYGGGAVLIRELARRRDRSWTRILFLGVAFALIEEGLVFQTMFNPTLFNAAAVGGRLLGVNWIFTEWVIGYHVVWSILIPIALTDLLFPAQRSEPWLGRAGTIVFGAIYALGALAIGFFIRSRMAPGFQAPATDVFAIVVLIVLMVILGVRKRNTSYVYSETKQEAPAPWIVGLTGFLAACLWFSLLHLPASLRSGAPAILPVLWGSVFAVCVFILLWHWSGAESSWTDRHCLALMTGALLASMLEGFFFTTAGNRIDQMGQGLASVISIILLAFFAWIIRKENRKWKQVL